MSRSYHSLRRYLASRRGSMLIMVIVILVLLFVIGAAMITTARVDRNSTVQNAFNVQADLLLDSVKTMAATGIADGLFGKIGTNKIFKPSPDQGTTYVPYDYAGTNSFLASRLPRLPSSDSSLGASATNLPLWRSVTMPLLGNATEAPGYSAMQFSLAKRQYLFYPTSGTLGSNTKYPFFRILSDPLDDGSWSGPQVTMPAADTDGDGIADALMFRLPVGELSGVTYYAAIRIVDHGSAVNLSTAWRPNTDYTAVASGQVPGDFFPTNIDLQNFLAGAVTESDALNLYRFDPSAAGVASLTPQADPVSPATTPTARTDFVFVSPYDAMWQQLGRRLSNPGFNTAAKKYQALGDSEAMVLAYPFGVYNSSLNSSTVFGTALPTSLQTNPYSGVFNANDTVNWYGKLFDFVAYTQASRPLRSVTVVRSPVATSASPHDMTNLVGGLKAPNQPNGMPVYTTATAVPKVSINTAGFPELWRGFWNVMAYSGTTAPSPDAVGGSLTGTTYSGKYADPTAHLNQTTAHMFSSVFRPPAAGTSIPAVPTAFEMMQLRAAIAAVNAIDLRDADDDVTSRKVTIYNAAGTATYDAMVYGTERQPFITEVYVNTDCASAGPAGETPNPKGYVAISLYNPYPVEISLKNWTLGLIDRRDGITYPLKIRQITPAATPVLPFQTLRIPPYKHVVLENKLPTGTPPNTIDANYRPASATCDATALAATLPPQFIYVPNLHEVLADPAVTPTTTTWSGSELVLLRPRKANGVLSSNADPSNINPFNETGLSSGLQASVETAMADMVPVDSYDFSNINLAPPAGPFQRVYYSRIAALAPSPQWKCVYPGVYSNAAGASRHETTFFQTWTPPALETSLTPIAVTPPPPNLGGDTGLATYGNPFPGIQLNNKDFAGPHGGAVYDAARQYYAGDVVSYENPAGVYNRYLCIAASATGGSLGVPPTNTTNWEAQQQLSFPFGGFARNGDLLQIPYIGAYKLLPAGGAATSVMELNSVSMDSIAARDGVASDDATEQLGRFCPRSASPSFVVTDTDYYAWASDLLDFFTVQAPNDDYLPNVDPSAGEAGLSPAPGGKYQGLPLPVGVSNAGITPANGATELNGPVEGLVNINTAPWIVLAQVPFFPPTQDLFGVDPATGKVTATPNSVPDNADVARLIVGWRDGNCFGYTTGPRGPFTSLLDLNKIVPPLAADAALNFQNGFGTLPAGTDPDDTAGDITPLNTYTASPNVTPLTVDSVRDDFEEKFLMVNRVSNLLTTRSDAFTVYIQLQGWRNVSGGGSPELVVQRKAAMIVDRTQVNKPTDSPKATNVPTE